MRQPRPQSAPGKSLFPFRPQESFLQRFWQGHHKLPGRYPIAPLSLRGPTEGRAFQRRRDGTTDPGRPWIPESAPAHAPVPPAVRAKGPQETVVPWQHRTDPPADRHANPACPRADSVYSPALQAVPSFRRTDGQQENLRPQCRNQSEPLQGVLSDVWKKRRGRRASQRAHAHELPLL